MIRNILLSIMLLYSLKSSSQMNMNQLIKFPLGDVFNDSKPIVSRLFTKSPKILKADFLGAYRIEFDDNEFDYYGLANYRFQYVKDTLAAIQINFSFEANDTLRFKRLLFSLVDDLERNPTFRKIIIAPPLNVTEAINYVTKYSKFTSKRDDKGYKPIKTKFLGAYLFKVNSETGVADKYIYVRVNLNEKHRNTYEVNERNDYHGSIADVTIEYIDKRYFALMDKEGNTKGLNYSTLRFN